MNPTGQLDSGQFDSGQFESGQFVRSIFCCSPPFFCMLIVGGHGVHKKRAYRRPVNTITVACHNYRFLLID